MDAVETGYEEDNEVSALFVFSSPLVALISATPHLDHRLTVDLFLAEAVSLPFAVTCFAFFGGGRIGCQRDAVRRSQEGATAAQEDGVHQWGIRDGV